MIHYIENEQIRIGVKEFGAELTSFYNKQNHTEYLWQGDSEIWGGQSPVLFPIIGRLKDDRYTVGQARSCQKTPVCTDRKNGTRHDLYANRR